MKVSAHQIATYLPAGGCLGGFPIGVGCAVSGEGGLAFAVQSEATSPGTGELILTGTHAKGRTRARTLGAC